MRAALVILMAWAAAQLLPQLAAQPLPQLKVSPNHRYLQTADGKPFFYLGDTAWELFHRLNREDAAKYLDDRAKKGYTVIQAVALGELDGLLTPNAYGHLPLQENDPARPRVVDGPANDYWDHVDAIVKLANERGLYVGFLPTWGHLWNMKWGAGQEVFTPENAAVYGEWIGRRYKDAGVIWILGGDRPVETARQQEIVRALARGLKKGDGGRHLMTFHPAGGSGSAEIFHAEEWLDFNMRQNGHAAEFTGRYDKTALDYGRTPVKPVLDGEPIYEGHPVNFKPGELGYSIAADVRHTLYWDLFSGACGHTYGHHSVWQFYAAGRKPVNNPLMPWDEAIAEPGAGQMQYGRRLMESRPYFTRVPDETVVVTGPVPTAMPGAGRYRFVATRDEEGRYAMVYAPVGRRFQVRMEKIRGARVVAWWFNPRDGKAQRIGEFPNTGERWFTPPDVGEALDWVLVLDDAAQGYGAPGQR